MAKNIVKELIIILLLCLAIILVLGLLLYEYVPMSKVIPDAVSYVTPEEVQQELLAAGEIDESQIVMTYEIDSTDLSNYKTIQNYKPGKTNPFSTYEASGENTTVNNSSGQNTTNVNSETSNNSNNSEQTNRNETNEAYFQDKGTK